jgi:hypothetical protein
LSEEGKLEKDKQEVAVPSWDVLEAESREIQPGVWLFISNNQGEIIRKIGATNASGFQRVSWDYSTESVTRITDKNVSWNPSGPWVAPGQYGAQLYKQIDGQFQPISDLIQFDVKALESHVSESPNFEEVVSFWESTEALSAKARSLSDDINEAQKSVEVFMKAYQRASKRDENLEKELVTTRNQLLLLAQKLGGSDVRNEVGEKNEYPTLWSYLYPAISGTRGATSGPTEEHKKYLAYAQTIEQNLRNELVQIVTNFESYKSALIQVGAPEIK